MAGEKHRGAPKKMVKKPSAKAKDKAAKKLATQLGGPPQPVRPVTEFHLGRRRRQLGLTPARRAILAARHPSL